MYQKLKETATKYVIILHFIEKEKKEEKQKHMRVCREHISTIPVQTRGHISLFHP